MWHTFKALDEAPICQTHIHGNGDCTLAHERHDIRLGQELPELVFPYSPPTVVLARNPKDSFPFPVNTPQMLLVTGRKKKGGLVAHGTRPEHGITAPVWAKLHRTLRTSAS